MTKQAVSLVLASGGARGIAHIGVIEELERQNFEIKAISGTSMGAIVGGIYAAGYLQEYKEWLLKLDKLDVFRLMDFTLSSHGFIKGMRIFDEIEPFLGNLSIEELPISFSAVAVDLIRQEEVVFRSGKLKDALRASVSIPNVLEPYRLDGQILIDGGILNPIPLNRVEHQEDNLLIAVDLNALDNNQPALKRRQKTHKKKKKEIKSLLKRIEFKEQWDRLFPKEKKEEEEFKIGYFDIMDSSFDMMQNQISKFSIEKYPPDILVSISKTVCGTFDFHLAQELIDFGKEKFNKSLIEYDEEIINKYLKSVKK
ncbi:MAG: patatin-like phospholipase family protein [Bacteroidales bacterium]|nr:patatin-like phospholipase family protein [Bacteroidales bacterium]